MGCKFSKDDRQVYYDEYKARVNMRNFLIKKSMHLDQLKAQCGNCATLGQDSYNMEVQQYEDVAHTNFRDWYRLQMDNKIKYSYRTPKVHIPVCSSSL
jgi:hypothetical protein